MSFIEDNYFEEKNIEFAQKILERKENDFIINTYIELIEMLIKYI